MKDDIISNVSHELKTPLVPIIGYSELVNEGALGRVND
ncbi:MAG: histidine kinase dimerization/phospho-acceptor domain-containing protein [Methanohalophilus sp.]